MKHFLKLLLLGLLVAINAHLVTQVSINDIDVEEFFPEKTASSTNTSAQNNINATNRYLFVANVPSTTLSGLQEQALISEYMAVPFKEHTYLILFKYPQQAHVLAQLQLNKSDYLGTPIVGTILSQEFLTGLKTYLWILIPILLPIIVLLTSFRYLLNLSNEVLVFSLLILSCIVLFKMHLNAAYLLSLLFIYIYAFTLINQVYYNKIATPTLLFSLLASLLTTWLSALLLSFSNFGIIKDFGWSLMLWLGVLSVYILLRVMGFSRSSLQLHWLNLKPSFLSSKMLGLIAGLFVVIFALWLIKPMTVNLNPLAMSTSQQHINQFEQQHTLTQPILMSVTAHHCSLKTVQCNQELATWLKEVYKNLNVNYALILDLEHAYQTFAEEPLSHATPQKLAQFQLSLDLLGAEKLLYNQDFTQVNSLFSVSLLQPLEQLIIMTQKIQEADQASDQFSVHLVGHMNQVAQYQATFLQEMGLGVLYIFILLAGLFALFYQDLKVTVSLVPALLSMMALLSFHSLMQIDLSIMTLIALILFVGIISDNIIHILIAYKTVQNNCFKTVFRPIILTNLIMIASLLLMALINHSFLKQFGLELASLLIVHLILMVYLLPSLFKTFLTRPGQT
ncbi:efflux RND transporter permease subunit [Thiomicrorhabdus aquaedulcis]|uniref:efflux RND transporter permease subunit n=1 Tax=Thiomicrorhabdus aquaedulcis TaxID=2211106 RepID=UPI000FDAC785|nr:efflux RND transporter permease subunit [Thiomicrorhabdus aquaedulcis]